jgi:hypothetical protein
MHNLSGGLAFYSESISISIAEMSGQVQLINAKDNQSEQNRIGSKAYKSNNH